MQHESDVLTTFHYDKLFVVNFFREKRLSTFQAWKFFVSSLLLALPLVAGAQSTYTSYNFSIYSPTNQTATVTNFPGRFTASGTSQSPSGIPGGLVTIEGESSFGTAKASTSASGAGYAAYAYAGWKDLITFDGGALNGQHGVVTVALSFDWTLTSSVLGAGSSRVGAMVDINYNTNRIPGLVSQYVAVSEDVYRDCASPDNCTSTNTGFEIFQNPGSAAPMPFVVGHTAYFNLEVIFGQTTNIDIAMNTGATGVNAVGFADATHSLLWGGIEQVVNNSGTTVPYQVTAASGFDYSSPIATVPEPASTALLVAGLMATAFVLRVRRPAANGGVKPASKCG